MVHESHVFSYNHWWLEFTREEETYFLETVTGAPVAFGRIENHDAHVHDPNWPVIRSRVNAVPQTLINVMDELGRRDISLTCAENIVHPTDTAAHNGLNIADGIVQPAAHVTEPEIGQDDQCIIL